MAQQQTAERRNFYRVDDVVYLEYRPVSKEELGNIEAGLAGQASPQPPRDEYLEQLASISKQITPLISEIRKDSPTLARFLEGLNKKVDLLVGRVFTELGGADEQPDATVQVRSNVNLSAGGVAFNAEEGFDAGEYLHLRIVTTTEGFVIDSYGQVIRCGRENREPARPYRLRVKFAFLDDADRRMLMRHIMAKQRETIRKQSTGP